MCGAVLLFLQRRCRSTDCNVTPGKPGEARALWYLTTRSAGPPLSGGAAASVTDPPPVQPAQLPDPQSGRSLRRVRCLGRCRAGGKTGLGRKPDRDPQCLACPAPTPNSTQERNLAEALNTPAP